MKSEYKLRSKIKRIPKNKLRNQKAFIDRSEFGEIRRDLDIRNAYIKRNLVTKSYGITRCGCGCPGCFVIYSKSNS